MLHLVHLRSTVIAFTLVLDVIQVAQSATFKSGIDVYWQPRQNNVHNDMLIVRCYGKLVESHLGLNGA